MRKLEHFIALNYDRRRLCIKIIADILVADKKRGNKNKMYTYAFIRNFPSENIYKYNKF